MNKCVLNEQGPQAAGPRNRTVCLEKIMQSNQLPGRICKLLREQKQNSGKAQPCGYPMVHLWFKADARTWFLSLEGWKHLASSAPAPRPKSSLNG